MSNLVNVSESCLSDLFKDVHGCRPRHYNEFMTQSEFHNEVCHLQTQLVQVELSEQQYHANSKKEFEQSISQTIDSGAGNRATALRWLLDSDEPEYTLWDFGISHSDTKAYVTELTG